MESLAAPGLYAFGFGQKQASGYRSTRVLNESFMNILSSIYSILRLARPISPMRPDPKSHIAGGMGTRNCPEADVQVTPAGTSTLRKRAEVKKSASAEEIEVLLDVAYVRNVFWIGTAMVRGSERTLPALTKVYDSE